MTELMLGGGAAGHPATVIRGGGVRGAGSGIFWLPVARFLLPHSKDLSMLRIMDTLASLVARRAPMLASRRGDASEKASATGPLIALKPWVGRVGAARLPAFAREGFMQNAIVYRSVRMVAEAAATVPLLLYEGDEEIMSIRCST